MDFQETLTKKNKIIYILIAVLFVCGLFIYLWQSNQNLKAEIAVSKAKTEMKETIEKNDKQLEEITKRETEYAKIKAQQSILSNNISTIDAKQKELNKIKKEDIYETNKNKSLSDIRDSYIKLGFPCTVISK